MTAVAQMASNYAEVILDHPRLQHGAVRVGLWLVGVAQRLGGFPVEAHLANFIHGMPDIGVQGVQYRAETVIKGLESLEAEGLLTVEPGHTRKGGVDSKLYTLNLE